MSRLKPCPFCGDSPELRRSVGFEGGYQIRCINLECEIKPKTNWFDTEQETIKAWNTRKSEVNINGHETN